jgi:hypothetical protein
MNQKGPFARSMLPGELAMNWIRLKPVEIRPKQQTE